MRCTSAIAASTASRARRASAPSTVIACTAAIALNDLTYRSTNVLRDARVTIPASERLRHADFDPACRERQQPGRAVPARPPRRSLLVVLDLEVHAPSARELLRDRDPRRPGAERRKPRIGGIRLAGTKSAAHRRAIEEVRCLLRVVAQAGANRP